MAEQAALPAPARAALSPGLAWLLALALFVGFWQFGRPAQQLITNPHCTPLHLPASRALLQSERAAKAGIGPHTNRQLFLFLPQLQMRSPDTCRRFAQRSRQQYRRTLQIGLQRQFETILAGAILLRQFKLDSPVAGAAQILTNRRTKGLGQCRRVKPASEIEIKRLFAGCNSQTCRRIQKTQP